MSQGGHRPLPRTKAARAWNGLLQRFRRDRRGAAAVEFAMISVPFFGLLFAIFQIGYVFFAQEGLDAATADAGRQLMTGQAQGNSAITSASQFRDSLICNPTAPNQRILPDFINCSQLVVDVSQASAFASANTSESFYTNPTMNYNPGGANCIVVVRVVYPMPAVLSILVGSGQKMTTGQTNYNGTMSYILMSTAVFRNEPFPGASYASC